MKIENQEMGGKLWNGPHECVNYSFNHTKMFVPIGMRYYHSMNESLKIHALALKVC